MQTTLDSTLAGESSARCSESVRVPPGRVVGGVLVRPGWGISDACPGPIAAQLGAGRERDLAVEGAEVL
jgi:hypothetical protein